MLEGRVLRRLLQVAVHLARSREDALDAGRGGGRGEVLLDHLRERRPLALLRLPPREHLDLNVLLLGLGVRDDGRIGAWPRLFRGRDTSAKPLTLN